MADINNIMKRITEEIDSPDLTNTETINISLNAFATWIVLIVFTMIVLCRKINKNISNLKVNKKYVCKVYLHNKI